LQHFSERNTLLALGKDLSEKEAAGGNVFPDVRAALTSDETENFMK